MKLKLPSTIFTSLFLLLVSISAPAQQEPPPPPPPAGFFTLIKTPLAIEGMTGDGLNLYIPGRNPGAGNPCPVWRVNIHKPSLVVVGFIPPPSSNTQCAPLGLTFNFAGELFVADGDRIYTFTPNESEPPTATLFASGVPGANGVAFDGFGRLWTGDGTTNQGRVWRIDPTGGVCEPDFIGCAEVFRIQPMRNGLNVGRENSTTQPTGASNPQNLVANGLVFNAESTQLFVSDTARGAIWVAAFDAQGELISQTNCDTTFTPNTLCLHNVFVAHPFLEGADGILLDGQGNLWVDANERNAVILVAPSRKVGELFRNDPDPKTGLRNTFPFEFPTSPVLMENLFCTANSDGNRRDNSPNTAGEITPAGPDRGKISCIRFN
jgi:sugar lactone lactonase YvrE